jgi:hypothetical protein
MSKFTSLPIQGYLSPCILFSKITQKSISNFTLNDTADVTSPPDYTSHTRKSSHFTTSQHIPTYPSRPTRYASNHTIFKRHFSTKRNCRRHNACSPWHSVHLVPENRHHSPIARMSKFTSISTQGLAVSVENHTKNLHSMTQLLTRQTLSDYRCEHLTRSAIVKLILCGLGA